MNEDSLGSFLCVRRRVVAFYRLLKFSRDHDSYFTAARSSDRLSVIRSRLHLNISGYHCALVEDFCNRNRRAQRRQRKTAAAWEGQLGEKLALCAVALEV